MQYNNSLRPSKCSSDLLFRNQAETALDIAHNHLREKMLNRTLLNSSRIRVQQSYRKFATVEKSTGSSVIGSDGRHEIWRGDVDHDNEPKVRYRIGSSG